MVVAWVLSAFLESRLPTARTCLVSAQSVLPTNRENDKTSAKCLHGVENGAVNLTEIHCVFNNMLGVTSFKVVRTEINSLILLDISREWEGRQYGGGLLLSSISEISKSSS